MSHLTCTSTPGRRGHLGGLFGMSVVGGRDAVESFAVCADKTLYMRMVVFVSVFFFKFLYCFWFWFVGWW